MPCLLGCLALSIPRVVIAGLWLFSSWFTGVFPSALWPALGFFFLPTTLLWYSAVQNWYGGRWTFLTVLGMIVALIIDISPGSSRRKSRTHD